MHHFINTQVLVVDSLNYVVRSVDMTCPLGYAPINGAGQCVLPASSIAAIILVGVLTPLLCILSCCCALMVHMARKERREEAERLAKVTILTMRPINTVYHHMLSAYLIAHLPTLTLSIAFPPPHRQQKLLVSRLNAWPRRRGSDCWLL